MDAVLFSKDTGTNSCLRITRACRSEISSLVLCDLANVDFLFDLLRHEAPEADEEALRQ